MAKYRCYFITAADRAETAMLIEADSPAKAAEEATSRRAGPFFVALEVWDGPVRVLQMPLHQQRAQQNAYFAQATGP